MLHIASKVCDVIVATREVERRGRHVVGQQLQARRDDTATRRLSDRAAAQHAQGHLRHALDQGSALHLQAGACRSSKRDHTGT